MEQRRSIRVTLNHVQAQVILDNGSSLSVLLSDFSEQGALLLLSEPYPLEPREAQMIVLRFLLDLEDSEEVIDVRATVRHRSAEHVGVRFDNLPRLLLERLQREVLVPTPKNMNSRQKEVFQELRDVTVQFVQTALRNYAGHAEMRLIDARADARSDTETQLLVVAQVDFSSYVPTMIGRFIDYLHPLFSQWHTPKRAPGVQKAQIRQLSLIEKDEFEDWLTIKVMVNKVESGLRENLMALQLRLDDLMKVQAGKQFNPFAPMVFCDAFKFSMAQFNPEAKVESLLYRSFEEEVLSGLHDLYQQLNALLASRGVLPDLDLARYLAGKQAQKVKSTSEKSAPEKPKPELSEAGKPEAHAAAESPSASGNQSSLSLEAAPNLHPERAASRLSARLKSLRQNIDKQQSIAKVAYETAKRLSEFSMSLAETDAPAEEQEAIPLSPVPQVELHEVLRTMQRRGAYDDHFLMDLQKELARQAKGLSRGDLATCQMVDGLVRSMMQMDTLTESVYPWFEQLRLPLLRLVLQDEHVFQTEQHPARLMLNRLARLGMKGQVLTESQRQEIQELLEGVVAAEDVDQTVFEQTLPTLDRMVRRQEDMVERNLRRVAQLAESEQRRDMAQSRVEEELDRRLANQEVPQALLTLLQSGWRDLLIMTYVRDGDQGDGWKRYWSVIDDLLNRGKSLDYPVDLRDLLTRIKQGLLASGVSAMHDVEQRVAQELKQLLSSEDGTEPVVRVKVESLARLAPVQSIADQQAVDDPVLLRCMQKCRQLQAGDWIEMDRNGQAEQLRLAWIGRDHARFVFVNHQGLKVCDFSLYDLSVMLRDEQVRILEAPPQSPVDDALERMVQSMYDQLTWASTHDELTGLVNRREFEKLLEKAMERSRRMRVRHVVLYCDLDHFGLINSDAGYDAGDALLREIVKIFEGVEHGKRSIARLGGDEFGLLLENCDTGRAQHIVTMLMQAIADYRFTVGEKVFHVTCCAGVLEVTHQSETADLLLRSAESACRQAKETPGGNRLQWYIPGDQDQARRQDVMGWVSRINQALEENRMELRCQKIAPLSAAGEQEGMHYEILLSMQQGDGSLIAPGTFMQAAERYGRMKAVDRWVISSVMRWIQDHPQQVNELGGFSINLSGHSLNDESLMEFIFEQFAQFKIPRDKLCFEVTETTAIANLADAADFIQEMKNIGCRFALDDFGAGMSSYAYLKNLPVDFIKIDGSFIKNLHKDAHDFAMVKSIHEMARMLDKLTIAEYVENDAIMDRLKEIGVDFVQGYGIEKPKLLSSLAQS